MSMLTPLVLFMLARFCAGLGMWSIPLLVVAFVAMLYLQQTSILYVPTVGGTSRANRDNPKQYRSPAEWGLPFEDARIRTADGVTLGAWFVRAPKTSRYGASAPTLLYFHGNAGNVGIRLPNIAQLHHECEVAVLAVDYRGYGDSEEAPRSQPGLEADAAAALAWARARPDVAASKLFIFGRSLGGAVGIALAASPAGADVCGVIVENSFTRVADIARTLFAPLRLVPQRLLRERLVWNKWESVRLVGRLRQPLLLISGRKDELVPPAMMDELHGEALRGRGAAGGGAAGLKAGVEMSTFADGTHNETWRQDGYYQVISAFIKKQVARRCEELEKLD
eukprot:g7440.t1